MAVIRVENLRHRRKKNGESVVSAVVAGEEVWFSSPDVELKALPEVFLSAFLIVSQLRKDRLSCETAVCKRWRRNARKLLAVTNGWWKLAAKPPRAPVHARGRRRKWLRKTALFFTAGVDSFHTLLEYPSRVHALVNIEGYDIPLENTARRDEAARSYQAVAKARRVPLIRIRTNLREHPYFQKANWEFTHGSAMAAAAHLLTGRYHDFILSSSTRAGDPRAWGSTWQIDHRWSSESLRFAGWGDHLSRAEKAGRIAGHPLVREHLRVCWQSADAAANCGVCPKCTRTMVSLAWAGALEPLKPRFAVNPDLVEAVGRWKPKPIDSPDELDPVLLDPQPLPGPLRAAVAAVRDGLLADLAARKAPKPSSYRRILLPDSCFREMLKLSEGRRVFYHKVPGNVGDDLIHAATRQLFKRAGITVVKTLEEADQVVMCGGGSIGIWDNCAEARRKVYEHCVAANVPVILYPQSVGGADETIPELVAHRFVREWNSLPLMPGSRLMPDMALAYHVPKDYGPPAHERGLFLRGDREAMFPDHPRSLGDAPRMVPRDLDAYFQLAAGYAHLVTDRLHFAIIGLLLKRRVTLLPNKYHKNRGMWETWLRDLGCAWADTPEEALSPAAPAVVKSARRGLGMVMCVHNEELLLEANLRYHHAVGVDTAYLFLDRCTDRSEEIARSFPWVRVIHRDTPGSVFHIREHQCACMNDALEMAAADGLEWLLGIDADEFAFARNKVAGKSPAARDRRDLREDLRDSPNARLWLRANLPRLLRGVPAKYDQVALATREALPLALDAPARFWEQDYFLSDGVYPGEILDPQTREWRRMDHWLGHNQGKPIIRTTARVEALNAHLWVKWQGPHAPGDAWRLPVPTLKHGWHSHYYCIEPELWLKKFRDVARNHAHWPSGKRVEFPKLEWSRAAVDMSVEDARAYLAEGVLIRAKTARKWAAKHKGVSRETAWSRLIAEVMDRHDDAGEWDDAG